jgi:hypothetical protein
MTRVRTASNAGRARGDGCGDPLLLFSDRQQFLAQHISERVGFLCEGFMPATVVVRCLGEPEKEAHLRLRLEELLKDYAGIWRVRVRGSEAIWEMTVSGPGDRGQWVYKKLYRATGEHDIDPILSEVWKIAEQIRKETKATT